MRIEIVIPTYALGRPIRRFMASRWKWPVAVAAVGVLVVFGIGLVSLGRTVFRLKPLPASSHQTMASGIGSQSATTGSTETTSDQITHIKEANFSYLTPKLDADWDYDFNSLVYDATKQVVRYSLKFHNSQVQVVVTQQAMPPQLMPRTSNAFMSFMNANKVARSQDVGQGTLYFLPALKNGVLGAGSDTVIYATDSVLLFAKADQMVGYDPWLKLLGKMQITSP